MNLLNRLFLIAVLFILAACAGVGVPPAEAEVYTFYWGAPTTHMDGTPITEPLLYRIYCGAASRAYAAPYEAGAPLEAPISGVLDASADGKYYCAFTAYFDTPCDGSPSPGICESAKSNEVTVHKRSGIYYDGREPGDGMLRTR